MCRHGEKGLDADRTDLYYVNKLEPRERADKYGIELPQRAPQPRETMEALGRAAVELTPDQVPSCAGMIADAQMEAHQRCTCDPQPAVILSVLGHSRRCSYYKDRTATWGDEEEPPTSPGPAAITPGGEPASKWSDGEDVGSAPAPRGQNRGTADRTRHGSAGAGWFLAAQRADQGADPGRGGTLCGREAIMSDDWHRPSDDRETRQPRVHSSVNRAESREGAAMRIEDQLTDRVRELLALNGELIGMQVKVLIRAVSELLAGQPAPGTLQQSPSGEVWTLPPGTLEWNRDLRGLDERLRDLERQMAALGLPADQPATTGTLQPLMHGAMEAVPPGKIPGVGWVLPRGAKTSRNGTINVDAHPLGRASYAEAANPILYPPRGMKERWPEWDRGYEGEHPPAHQTEVLVTLWRARRIPGLSPADHDRYVGVPTAEEVNDLYALADTHPHKRAIQRAWMELSSPPGTNPVPDPKPGPVVPPVVPPSPPVGLRPLSPAAVRVEELRQMATALWMKLPEGSLKLYTPLIDAWTWDLFKPFAVEALRTYRAWRRSLGVDTRPIPPEDRP
jgi:hypothetical protein